MNIEYTKDLSGISEDMLDGGFFVGWPNPPNKATHMKILRNAYCAVLAVDRSCGKVVGFVNAISDGVLAAYVPLLEVLPDYQGQGIGSELIKRILEELGDIYMVDICHDEELAPYYARFGAYPSPASLFRNFDAQSGRV
ncbi:MAG: GNAT family N-acetyltransferase [Clostridiales bacterium]|nr:GNAT family N-acetyltransferase [Clostridiales bacterium]